MAARPAPTAESKEDQQMLCPLAYDDPSGVWPSVLEYITPSLPLRDVVCKSPTSGASISLALLPLRFMPSTANLFKDTDHPFRWFLAPYVELYLVRAETLDNYKSIKPSIKAWVDARTSASTSSMKKSSWLLLYVPQGTPSALDSYNKVYARLSSDFYTEKAGDRSIFLLLGQEYVARCLDLPPQHASSFSDFISRIKKYIVASFQQRTTLYDADIRRLDSFRGTPQLDFRQLFLVKESLALMYQMMQLPSESFIQYEELEALLAFAPPGHLPDNDWPMVSPESTSKTASKHQAEAAAAAAAGAALESAKEVSEPTCHDTWSVFSTPCRLGDEVLVYSINASRMKILKNKMGVAELQRYLFARQMYFLSNMKNLANYAQKGLAFLQGATSAICEKLKKRRNTDRERDEALRMRQAHLWGVCASLQIAKSCREQVANFPKAATKEVSDILNFTLGALKHLISVSDSSKSSSLQSAYNYTCWHQHEEIIPTPSSSAGFDDADALEVLLSTEADLDAFSDKFHEAAPLLVTLSDVGKTPTPPTRTLEAQLVVMLLKCVEAGQVAAARSRHATLASLQLADVLMHIGAFKQAAKAYIDILLPSSSYHSSARTLDHWPDFRFATLRKLLVCSRFADQVEIYLYTALQLLDPSIRQSYGTSPTWIKAILNDVSKLSNDHGGALLISNQPSSFILPLRQYFSTSVSFDVEPEKTCKMIHDEMTSVTIAHLQGGTTQRLHLRIFSSFPEAVTVHSLVATYGAFNLLQAGAVSARGAGDLVLGELDKDNMFECTTPSAEAGPRLLIIQPGEQTVDLEFRPPCTGEYGLVKIQVSIGSIVLRDNLSCNSLGDLQKFCQVHDIISIEQPSSLLNLKVESSPFSPAGQMDDVHVTFHTLEGDQITGLRIWAIPLSQNPEPGQAKTAGTVQAGEAHKADTWSKKLQPPTPPSPNTPLPISIDKVSHWSVSRNSGLAPAPTATKSSASDFTAVAKRESPGLEHLSFSPLRGKVEVVLKIPFSVDSVPEGVGRRKKGGGNNCKIAVSIVLQGVLLRQECAIAFDVRAECLVHIAQGLHVQATPLGLLGDEFFLQCLLYNSSPLALSIHSFGITCNEGGSVWSVIEAPAELTDGAISATKTLTRENLTLYPGNEFHAAFRIKIGAADGNHSRIGHDRGGGVGNPTQQASHIAFTYQRAGAGLGAWWANSRSFRTVGSIHPLSVLVSSSSAKFRLSSQPGGQTFKLGQQITLTHELLIQDIQGGDGLSIVRVVVKAGEDEAWVPIGQTKQIHQAQLVSVSGKNPSLTCIVSFSTTHIPVSVGILRLPPLLIGLSTTPELPNDDYAQLVHSSSGSVSVM